MVDLANIGRVSMLIGEKNSIVAALHYFSVGGRIVAFGIDPVSETYDGPSPAVTVISRYMNYPPAMVQSITAMMQARLADIQQQLTEMGITGIDQAQPRAAPAAPFGVGTPPPGMPGPTPGPTQGPKAPPPPKAPQFVGPRK